jgi:hypothetical protein
VQKDFSSSDIRAIDIQIESKIDGIRDRNNIQEIAEYKRDINNFLVKKAKIVGELSPFGGDVKKLIEEKERYQEEIYRNSEYITAPNSGVVSYRIDNLENTLRVDNFDEIDWTSLLKKDLKTGQVITSSNENGKVVDNFKCYIVVSLNSEEAKAVELENRIRLRLAGFEEVTGTVKYIRQENDGSSLIVFEITKGVEELINYRKISVDIIWWEHSGLRVPNRSIIHENGLSYVVRNRARIFR